MWSSRDRKGCSAWNWRAHLAGMIKWKKIPKALMLHSARGHD